MNRTDVEREQELATRLGIPITTWQTRRRQGRVPEYFRIGRTIYYTAEAVEAWLNEQRNAAS